MAVTPAEREAREALAKMEARSLRSWQVFWCGYEGHKALDNGLSKAEAEEREAKYLARMAPGDEVRCTNLPDPALAEQISHLRTALDLLTATRERAEGAALLVLAATPTETPR